MIKYSICRICHILAQISESINSWLPVKFPYSETEYTKIV